MYPMNSSVTWDSAISVISSLCLAISASSRSNGPSKTSRCTWKPPRSSVSAVFMTITARIPGYRDRSLVIAQPLGHQATLSRRLQIGEQHRQRLPDDPATVNRDAIRQQRQPRPFQVNQLGPGQVDGDLLRMTLPAARLPLRFDGRAVGGRPQ